MGMTSELPAGWKSTDPNNLGGYWKEKAEREYRATELGYPAWRVLWLCDEEYNDTMHADFMEGCRKMGQRLAQEYHDKVYKKFLEIMQGEEIKGVENGGS